MVGRVGSKFFAIFLLLMLAPFSSRVAHSQGKTDQEIIQHITEYRERRDQFFKEHPRSPLDDSQRRSFNGLTYYPIGRSIVSRERSSNTSTTS